MMPRRLADLAARVYALTLGASEERAGAPAERRQCVLVVPYGDVPPAAEEPPQATADVRRADEIDTAAKPELDMVPGAVDEPAAMDAPQAVPPLAGDHSSECTTSEASSWSPLENEGTPDAIILAEEENNDAAVYPPLRRPHGPRPEATGAEAAQLEEGEAPPPESSDADLEEEWQDFQAFLRQVRDESIHAAKQERLVFAEYADFRRRYGIAAEARAGKSPQLIADRQEERRAVKVVCDRRAAQRERVEWEHRIYEREKERLRAQRLPAEEEARRADEAVRHAVALEESLRHEPSWRGPIEEPSKKNCYVCGRLGVSRSNKCPDRHLHRV